MEKPVVLYAKVYFFAEWQEESSEHHGGYLEEHGEEGEDPLDQESSRGPEAIRGSVPDCGQWPNVLTTVFSSILKKCQNVGHLLTLIFRRVKAGERWNSGCCYHNSSCCFFIPMWYLHCAGYKCNLVVVLPSIPSQLYSWFPHIWHFFIQWYCKVVFGIKFYLSEHAWSNLKSCFALFTSCRESWSRWGRCHRAKVRGSQSLTESPRNLLCEWRICTPIPSLRSSHYGLLWTVHSVIWPSPPPFFSPFDAGVAIRCFPRSCSQMVS